MTQLKHTIFYLFVLCILFLGITYIIPVNKELVLSTWISYDFLLSCFIGILASVIVLIATETYKLFQMQNSIERWLFGQMVMLYVQLQIAETNIRRFLSSNSTAPIPSNLLHHLSNTINQITSNIRGIDYNPLFYRRKEKVVDIIIGRLHKSLLSNLVSLANNCIYFEIAINMDKIAEHQREVPNPIITSKMIYDRNTHP